MFCLFETLLTDQKPNKIEITKVRRWVEYVPLFPHYMATVYSRDVWLGQRV